MANCLNSAKYFHNNTKQAIHSETSQNIKTISLVRLKHNFSF